MALTKEETALVNACIESHRRMIKHHRRQIIELSQKLNDTEFTVKPLKIEIKNENIESKCGWSPFNGVEFKGSPMATIISGKIKMKDGKILGDPEGKALEFN